MNTTTPQVFTVKEAFQALKVSRPVGYRLLNTGTLESYTLGRRRYVTAAMLDRCVDRLSRAAGPRPCSRVAGAGAPGEACSRAGGEGA